jgi:hypothetical protein
MSPEERAMPFLDSFMTEYDPSTDPIKKGVPTYRHRADLGDILQEEHMTVGAELGVQRGLFSVEMLKRWPSCKEYHLVDLWAHQENYVDSANVRPRMQEMFYKETLTETPTIGRTRYIPVVTTRASVSRRCQILILTLSISMRGMISRVCTKT